MVSGLFLSGCPKKQLKDPAVIINNTRSQAVKVLVELAIDPDTQVRGLMYRKHLKSDCGMLFIYPAEKTHTFWMKNTYIPLDLIFIGSGFRIVGIVQNCQPLSLKQINIDAPSMYVLEVNAGFAAKHSIQDGCQVQFEGI